MFIDPSNVLTAQILTSVLSILSFAFSCFFIYVYLFTKSSEKFYLKLVYYLQISDAVQAIGLFLCIFDPESQPDTFCRLQSFLIQFGTISSVLWRSAISIVMYVSIKDSAETAESQEIRLLLLVFWISLLLSIMYQMIFFPFTVNSILLYSPFCSNDYGYHKVWCWFRDDIPHSRQQYLTYFLFYMELWISMLIILVITILVGQHLKRESRKSSLEKFRNKLKYYPLVVIAIWLIPTVDRILSSTIPDMTNDFSEVFAYFHIVALSLQGFANFFLYGFDYIRQLFKKNQKKPSIVRSFPHENCYTQLITGEVEQEEQRPMEIDGESYITDN